MDEMRALPSVEELSQRAFALFEARHAGDPEALRRIRESFPFPRLAGKSDDELLADFFTRVDASQVIAAEFGFGHWGELLEHEERPVDPDFEAAVDAVVEGDADFLRALLARKPELVHARSARKHAASLLHYVGANGVEDARQKTPPNAVEIATILLDAGALPDRAACTYFGGMTNTTMYLLVSSDHPRRAGVQGQLVELLVRYGANPDGVWNDGLPLATAIAFDGRPAMDALVRAGARVDNVVLAAATGNAEALAACFDGADPLPAALRLANHTITAPDDPLEALGQALIWSAKHGQLASVRFLLARGASARAELDLRQTALHWAAYHGHFEVALALLDAGADPDVQDARWDCTPLAWAAEGNQRELIELLLPRTEVSDVEAARLDDLVAQLRARGAQ